MSSQQLDEERIFHVAKDIPVPESRSEYLDQVCAGDRALRERVEALLAVHEREHEFLKSDVAPTEATTPVTESPGQQIGRYKLREQIGEGGMGVVFVAEQERPIRRKVALKIIKPGMDTKEVIARFEAERQALALMNHPNIAKVLDAGTTQSGRPYFVMELVQGIPITAYCDRYTLTTRQRLELFVTVCQAVQHAHQKGVIHRDLKPSNVLITEHDGTPVVKVIDFGVAKAINQRLTEQTIYTRFQQMVGTPMYMSPEQADLSGLDVDTRSDVYSLGVLLYEVLTGATPFDKQRLAEAAYDEIRRIIREEEPPKPSTKISTMGATASEISDYRQTDPRRLSQSLRGELDWIVMKAVEKDRSRRYETANGFAADIQRFLNDEAVTACPPSASYRFRKFARRNQAAIASLSAVSVALLAGLCLTTIGFLTARHESARAQRLADENAERRLEAERALATAELERQRTSDALAEAKIQRDRAEQSDYVSRIRLANERLDQGQALIVARQDLISAPPSFRDWEWGYLVGRAWPPPSALDLDEILPRKSGTTTAEFWARHPAREVTTVYHGGHARISLPALTPTPERLLTGMVDGAIRLWDIPTSNQVPGFPKLVAAAITAVAFSHDGTRLAAGNGSGDLFVFDADTRSTLWTKKTEIGRQLYRLWFSADDTRLLAVDGTGDVLVFETDSGNHLHTFSQHASQVQSLHTHADGKSVLSASRDGSIMLWNLETGRLIGSPQSVPHHGSNSPSLVTICPNRPEVAISYSDNSVALWDRETDEILELFKGTHEINYLVVSPDGTCVFAGEGESKLTVWNMAGDQINEIRTEIYERGALAFSADGTHMVIKSNGGTTSVWAPVPHETATRRVLDTAHDDLILQGSFSNDGKRIVTASYDKTARVWDAHTREFVAEFNGHEHEVLAAHFSPNGRLVASVDCRGTTHVWVAETGEAIHSISANPDEFFKAGTTERGLRGEITNFAVTFAASPFDEEGLVVNTREQMVMIDHTSGEHLLTFEDNQTIGWPVISSSGKRMASVTAASRQVRLWDLETGKQLDTVAQHKSLLYGAEFSPDGSRLVAGSADGIAFVWDVVTGKRLFPLKHPTFFVNASFDAQGGRIATAAGDGIARVWDASSGELLSTFSDHTSRLLNVQFSPDGTRIFSTSHDQSLRVWDPRDSDARELLKFSHGAKPTFGTWSPDGCQILTCWGDGTVHLLKAFPWTDGDTEMAGMDERIRQWRDHR